MRVLSLLWVLLLPLAACDKPAPAGGNGPMPVSVAHPIKKEVVEWDEYTGRFSAVERVEVRARVSGYIESVNFEDGAIVNKGDLLFVVDKQPFEIALREAQARVAFTKTDYERAANLVKKGTTSQQVRDQRLEASRIAEAALATAKLNLEFTEIRAAISGRVSRRLVTVGNLVSGGQATSTLLTVLVSLDPIHFYFDGDEAAYLKYVRLSESGDRPSSRDFANPVEIQLIGEPGFPHKGRMDFVDNEFDPGTGTIRGRAVLANPDHLFVPEMFGKLHLLGRDRYQALLLPDSAIGTDQNQRFVYVIGEGDIPQARPVTLGPLEDGLRIVRDGISADDLVVVNGLMRIRPGAPVTPNTVAITPGTAP